MWKDFLFFSANDRRAILFLSVLLLAGTAYLCLRPRSDMQPIATEEADSLTALLREEKDTFPIVRTEPSLHPFDPNEADSLTLTALGLRTYVVRNILRYRAAGGVFRTPEALSRIYGMTDEAFASLRPYIHIAPKYRPVPKQQAEKKRSYRQQPDTSAMRRYPAKYPVGTVIDLNRADTSQLKRIPGIGSVLSRRIVSYRHRLGGFVSLSQLQEIYNLPTGIEQWFTLTDTLPRPINLNADSIPLHPYLTRRQIRIITRHRQQRGKLKSLQQLSTYPEFPPADLERLKPYVTF